PGYARLHRPLPIACAGSPLGGDGGLRRGRARLRLPRPGDGLVRPLAAELVRGVSLSFLLRRLPPLFSLSALRPRAGDPRPVGRKSASAGSHRDRLRSEASGSARRREPESGILGGSRLSAEREREREREEPPSADPSG